MRTLLILLALTSLVSAQEVFIRNQEFQGEIVKSGGNFLVNLEALAESLDLKLQGDETGWLIGDGEAAPGTVWVQGERLPITEGQFGPLVSLTDFCRAVGAEMKRNSSLGTVDVYLTDQTVSSSGGVWLGELFDEQKTSDDVKASESGSYSSPDLGYNVTFSNSLKLVKAPPNSRIPAIELIDGEGNTRSGSLNVEFFLMPKNPTIKHALLALMTIGVDVDDVDSEIESTLVNGVLKAVIRTTPKISSGPRSRNFHGSSFNQYGFAGKKGKINFRGDLFFHYNPNQKTVYVFLAVDDKNTYRQNSRPLLRAVRSFKAKH